MERVAPPSRGLGEEKPGTAAAAGATSLTLSPKGERLLPGSPGPARPDVRRRPERAVPQRGRRAVIAGRRGPASWPAHHVLASAWIEKRLIVSRENDPEALAG